MTELYWWLTVTVTRKLSLFQCNTQQWKGGIGRYERCGGRWSDVSRAYIQQSTVGVLRTQQLTKRNVNTSMRGKRNMQPNATNIQLKWYSFSKGEWVLTQQKGLPACACVLFWGEGYLILEPYIQDDCGVDGGLHCRGIAQCSLMWRQRRDTLTDDTGDWMI